MLMQEPFGIFRERRRRPEDRLRRAIDAAELSARALDVLTAMLIGGAVLLPFFLAAGDVHLTVLFALAITAACFVLFFAANVLAERSARRLASRLRKGKAGAPPVRIIGPGRPR